MQCVIGNQLLQLHRKIGTVPRLEHQPATTAVNLNDFRDPAMIRHQHGCAVAHRLRRHQPERLAMNRWVHNATAALIQRVPHLIAHPPFPKYIQPQMLRNVFARIRIFLPETRTPHTKQLQFHTALAKNFHGIQQQIDPLFRILSTEIGDDRQIGLEARKQPCQRREIGRRIGWCLCRHLNPRIDRSHPSRIDPHFLVQSLGIITADRDRRPSACRHRLPQPKVIILQSPDPLGEIGENLLPLKRHQIIKRMLPLRLHGLCERADHRKRR